MQSVEKKNHPNARSKSRRYWFPLALGFLGVCAVAYVLLALFDFDLAEIKAHLHSLIGLVAQVHPSVLLLAIAILPCIGFPVSPLLVAGGLAYGIPIGLTLGFVGIFLNNALAYLLAAYPLRRFIEGLIHTRGWKIPSIPKSEETRVIIVLRITPGIPLPMQNYILGLARVPFLKCMILSILAQGLAIIAFVVTGGSLFEGSWGLIVLGVILIVVMMLVAKTAYNMYGTKINLKAEPEEPHVIREKTD